MSNTIFRAFVEGLGGTIADDYVGTPGDFFYDPVSTTLRLANGTPGGHILVNGSVQQSTYGCFHKVANVIALSANTVYAFDWFDNVTSHVNTEGVVVTSGDPTKISIDTTGSYLVTVEMLVKTEGNAPRDVFLWISKNNTDIDETAVKIEVRQGSVQTPVFEQISKQWLLHDIEGNDYIELKFAVSRSDLMSLEYTGPQVTPYARPAIPSAVITVVSI